MCKREKESYKRRGCVKINMLHFRFINSESLPVIYVVNDNSANALISQIRPVFLVFGCIVFGIYSLKWFPSPTNPSEMSIQIKKLVRSAIVNSIT